MKLEDFSRTTPRPNDLRKNGNFAVQSPTQAGLRKPGIIFMPQQAELLKTAKLQK